MSVSLRNEMGNNQLRLHAMDGPRARKLRGRLLDPVAATRLSRQGQALSDPARVRLLALMKDADQICVSDACLVTEAEQSGVSRHLRILWDAGLVDKAKRDKLVFYWPTTTGERLLAALLGDQ
jgi:DNA-binding transcriptional ArsR family regulator